MKARTIFLSIILATLSGVSSFAQEKRWSLDDCINYALEHNIQVQKASLSTKRNEVLTNQSKNNRLPSLNASVRQNFGWNKSLDQQTGEYGNLNGSNNTSYSVNSSVELFNGFKIQKAIQQNELNLESSKLDAESVKESVQLNILNAFLQVIYTEEMIQNAQKQIDATTEQLTLAQERLALGVISRSDFLQIQSELASEKLTLANANSQSSMAKVNLMQLMELPVNENFAIASPKIDALVNQSETPLAASIFETALGIKPQIKSSELTTKSSMLDIDIARAGLLPSLSMDAGLSTGYSSLNSGFNYPSQLNNSINPSLGLSLSIPIFQKGQVKSNISIAQISVDNAKLDEQNTRNQLRKEIEQACADAISAKMEYQASLEQQQSTAESYDVATEKFKQGMMNSVDFLFEKAKLISAESQLLQSKFNLVFSYKILDFYKGISLTL
jgi:outer membrane protein